MRSTGLGLALAAAATLALVAPAVAGTVGSLEAQLEEARERRASVEARLATEAGDLEGLAEQVTEVEQQLAALDERDEALRDELADVEAVLAQRSRAAFMRGEQTTLHVLVSARDFSDVADGAVLLESLALRDRATLEGAAVLRTQLATSRTERQATRDELAGLEEDLRDRVDQLMVDLEQLEADEERFGTALREAREEQRRREEAQRREEERRRAAEAAAAAAAAGASQDSGETGGSSPAPSAPAPSGGLACPVGNPVAFADTWGAPRSGGRSHQGVDMMAQHGTPVYAITSGRITRMHTSGLGGISLYMFGDDGNEYFYTHLQGYADVSTGMRVGAGTLIAYVGSTGNASASAPHLHFEVHPGGGRAVNPYPYAARACGR